MDADREHHCFKMIDRSSGRELENAIEVHTVELTKYNLSEDTISVATKLEQWAFLLLRAQDDDAKRLKELFLGDEFQQAIETIQAISEITEDRQMYDQREKAQRNYEWAINGACEEGREEGLEQGMARGLVRGIERGKLTGKIQTLQELLEERLSTDAELVAMDGAQLRERIEDLQSRLRNRDA